MIATKDKQASQEKIKILFLATQKNESFQVIKDFYDPGTGFVQAG